MVYHSQPKYKNCLYINFECKYALKFGTEWYQAKAPLGLQSSFGDKIYLELELSMCVLYSALLRQKA